MAGDLGTAGQTLDGIVARFPFAPNVHYLYGMCLLPSDPDRAIAEFRRELAITPRMPRQAPCWPGSCSYSTSTPLLFLMRRMR